MISALPGANAHVVIIVLGPKYDIDFASIKGPNPPVDPNSVTNYPDDQKFLDDPAVQQKLANAKKLSDVEAEDYDAIFYVGGFGPAIDLAFDTVNAKLASDVSIVYRSSCSLELTLSSVLAGG